MKIFLLAGELSGDAHAAALAREILVRRPDARLMGMGGPAMAAAGVQILKSIDDMQIMGFLEVVQNLRHIRRAFARVEADFRRERPDALILVDYPGFNLMFAKRVRDTGAKVLYYISPQVWAWHKSRLRTMKALIQRMLVIFDFEAPFYQEAGIPVEFVGHPLLDRDAATEADGKGLRRELGVGDDETLIALLPGSRRQEVQRLLPIFRRAGRRLTSRDQNNLRFVVASPIPNDRSNLYSAPHVSLGKYTAPVVSGRTHEIIRAADLAWVSSGTATLETALLDTPLICCYKAGAISYALASLIVDIPCISLVNIVAGRPVIPELVQRRLTPARLAGITTELLADKAALNRMREAFAQIRQKLGGPGAGARAAEAILRELE